MKYGYRSLKARQVVNHDEPDAHEAAKKGETMRRVVLMLGILLSISSGASAAGPFDGQWTGASAPLGDCGSAIVKMTVTESAISGRVSGVYKGNAVWGEIKSGHVGLDGAATIVFGGATKRFQGSLTFSSGKFQATLDGLCGQRNFSGGRDG